MSVSNSGPTLIRLILMESELMVSPSIDDLYEEVTTRPCIVYEPLHEENYESK